MNTIVAHISSFFSHIDRDTALRFAPALAGLILGTLWRWLWKFLRALWSRLRGEFRGFLGKWIAYERGSSRVFSYEIKIKNRFFGPPAVKLKGRFDHGHAHVGRLDAGDTTAHITTRYPNGKPAEFFIFFDKPMFGRGNIFHGVSCYRNDHGMLCAQEVLLSRIQLKLDSVNAFFGHRPGVIVEPNNSVERMRECLTDQFYTADDPAGLPYDPDLR